MSRILLALLLLAGAFLRVRLALDRPLWDDELWQRFVTREDGCLDFLLWRHDELVHPPLSFILNKLCCDLFQSDAAWVWRLPSIVAGILCIPAGFALGKKLGSPALALGIAAMLAFDLNTAWESANARMYSMFALGLLLALGAALDMRGARRGEWRTAVWLGFVLGALMWIHLLAAVVWSALGLALAASRVAGPAADCGRGARQNGGSRGGCPTWTSLAIAFGVACLLGFPGIARFFAVREGVGAAIPDRSPGEIFHLLYWVVNLLVWIEVRFISPLVLALSAIGAVAMLAGQVAQPPRLPASPAVAPTAVAGRDGFTVMSVLLLALGLLTALSQIHLLRTHPFSVMRYLIPAQPILWIGLPFLLLVAPPQRLRLIAAALFCLFLGVQAWNCTRLESTYGTVASDVRESRAFVDAVDFVKASKSASDAVAYLPHDRFAYRGEYFGLPASESIGGPAFPTAPRFPKPHSAPTPLNAPAVWIVRRARVSSDTDDRSTVIFDELVKQYLPNYLMPDAVFAPAKDYWQVTRIDRERVTERTFPIE